MKLKLDDKGNVVVQDGKPVYTHDDGKDIAFDAPAAVSKISGLNAEAKGHRERAEVAEGKLKDFEGIEDIAAAKKAIDIVKNLDEKKLVDAGKVEEVKAGVVKSYEAKLEEQKKAYETKLGEVGTKATTLEQQLHSEKIGGGFARSKFIAEKLAIPADLVQAAFGTNFKLEEGKIVAYDGKGGKIYSRSKPGEFADFEEALESLVDAYPHKETILKGSGSSGSGAKPINGNGGGKKTLTRAQFEALGPAEKITAARESTITD